MPDIGTPGDWLRYAESDLRLARLGRADPQVLPNQVGFHAQQAAEKALKGVLVGRGVEFPKTHHLDELIELVQDVGLVWPFAMDRVEALTPYAVQTRYPGALSEITSVQMDDAIQIADEVLTWARQEARGTTEEGS